MIETGHLVCVNGRYGAKEEPKPRKRTAYAEAATYSNRRQMKMRNKRVMFLLLTLSLGFAVHAQQAAPQPLGLTFYYNYSVKPGMEAEFMTLVKTVGQPVRDKLMADGVIHGWGIETPILRGPDVSTHLIWFAVNSHADLQKVMDAMQAQMAKVASDEAKAAAVDPKRKFVTTQERRDMVWDHSKTRDYLMRDVVANFGTSLPPAGTLPWTRYNFLKVKPGMGNAYRAAWEKYNKPVLDKLVADGTLLAFGLAVEELKTDSNWTHFVWQSGKDAGAFDKVRTAFAADRARRSQEERDAITAAFAVTEPDAVRNYQTRAVVFKLAGMK